MGSQSSTSVPCFIPHFTYNKRKSTNIDSIFFKKGENFKLIPASLISKKRDGLNLTKDEIKSFLNGYLSEIVTDEQMSAMLMAIYFNGMNEEETFSLVDIMLHSGKTLDFSKSKEFVADKHST